MGERDDLVRHVEGQLLGDLNVDAGLGPLRDEMHRARESDELAELSSKALRLRRRALESAVERLTRLDAQLQQLATLLPVLPGEWPDRQTLLDEALDRDLKAGITLWLADWWTAVGHGRLDAMERLIRQLGRTPAASILVDRANVIRFGLESNSRDVVARALESVVDGVVLDGQEMHDDMDRARLAGLVARMWLLHAEANGDIAGGAPLAKESGATNAELPSDQDDDTVETEPPLQKDGETVTAEPLDGGTAGNSESVPAEEADDTPEPEQNARPFDLTPYLERAADLGLSATAGALGARWQRLKGDVDEADLRLSRARKEDATDLDVAVELIEQARRRGDPVFADKAATLAVTAIPVISEVEPRIGALFYPVPVELWIATAQRALEEREFEVFDRAIAASLDLADRDTAHLAHIAELRVAAADLRDAPADEKVAALIDAGSNRIWSDTPELAIPYLERALQLAPDSDAAIFLANSLLSSCAELPLSAARARLEKAIELAGNARLAGLDAKHAWSFAIEAYARTALMDDVSVDADDHAWPALLAACRGLTHDLNEGARWRTLSETLWAMRANDLAVEVARHIVDAFGSNTEWRQLLAMTLANAGAPGQALESLEPSDDFRNDDWTQALRAFCILRVGNPVEATRILRTAKVSPDWTWATETLVSSLLLTGRISEGMAELPSLERHYADRMDQHSAVVSMGWIRLLQGRFSEAEALCGNLPNRLDDGGLIAASAATLQGRSDEGHARLRNWMQVSAGELALSDWPELTAPQLRVVAVGHKTTFPGLDELTALAEVRLGELAGRGEHGKAGVVGRFTADTRDETARLAAGMCDALLHIARGTPGQAAASLIGLNDDETVAQLQRSLADLTASAVDTVGVVEPATEPPLLADSASDWSAQATNLVSLIAENRTNEAREHMRSFLSRDAYSVAVDLWTASHSDYEAYADMTDILNDLSDEPDGLLAGEVWDLLRRWVALRLILPPSWFTDHPDPVTTHILFTQYIPQARTRMPELPGFRVSSDEDLEPAGYKVMFGTRVVEQNALPVGRRFAPQGAESLLGADPGSSLDEVLPGIVAVPDIPVSGLGQLLSVPAEELSVRRAGTLYLEWLESLDAAVKQDGT